MAEIFKVCLINPPAILPVNSLSSHGAVPPLGLAYIAAFIRKAGYSVSVVDAVGAGVNDYKDFDKELGLVSQGLSFEQICRLIPNDTQIVGITHTFLHEYYMIKELVAHIKKHFPNVTIVLGGENASSFYDQILNTIPEVDYIVRGEGEFTFLKLIDAIQNNEAGNIKGIAYRNSDGIVETGLGERHINIDDIPWPAWDMFPMEHYFANNLSSGVNRGRSISMLTSRGCPFQCSFCSAPGMWTTKYVAREPAEVVSEIEYNIRKYNIKNIDFQDLTSFLTKKWIKEFCHLVLEKELQFTWQLPQGSRSEVIDEESAELLYRSGCRNFWFALDSGSRRIIKSMKKKVNPDYLYEAMKIARKKGITTGINVIVGVPEERVTDILASYKYVLKSVFAGVEQSATMIFGPYPGSSYYKELVAKGKIQLEKSYIYSSLLRASNAKSYNDRISTRQLQIIQFFFIVSFWLLNFMLRPWRVFVLLRNLISNRHETIMDKLIYTKIKQVFAPRIFQRKEYGEFIQTASNKH